MVYSLEAVNTNEPPFKLFQKQLPIEPKNFILRKERCAKVTLKLIATTVFPKTLKLAHCETLPKFSL